ncbi:MAG: DNA internalization-related competence protein ComEC/Rec2 [Curvibacter sp. RIFCSPHIGHO2_12_FULL_63_18]|uniref:DNA internalization-related competence protein ComEC/Rec2 n=1 Tax=Rhodoferax sp. TaxID=50421 RepID=UPI0008C4B8B9|nr:DNA internalization-related competence protein ComEC/Rec2 [Rhodoferax sp.]OGO95049.1 MAG: DNA internalization-related competence protein ComEC/Rec2 [Curvibacter sp. GWA2_63_95]OGP02745.1 MAG: DNA internalization-related competence protein ComEC/Rec2 [Curvibacter sp. RIFCSPHIGHO2_12_FULL_63_18]HCX81526.1 DNA internalization-related competence protein ComEC/Rec2 [Rhodoferax sp.]
MFSAAHRTSAWPRTVFAALLGWVLGAALQLQQATLGSLWFYMPFMLLAPVLYAQAAPEKIAKITRKPTPLGLVSALVLLAGMALGWGSTGARAVVFASTALAPALEGRDLRVTGVVEGLPQTSEAGLRFTLRVEQALLEGLEVTVPARMAVAWYATGYALGGEQTGLQRVPAPLSAGERWQFTLRARAPHGSMNPHGFDYELWLWGQGVQASAYVRAGPKDPEPLRLGQTGWAPVALARQALRDHMVATVQDRRAAGLLAALVVGDQAAVERSDWDVFRATGVAHLISISGLHITMFAWGAAWLCGAAWRRSRRLCLALPASSAALLGGLGLACAYAVLAGWGVPAQRTCLMLATIAVLRLAGARWPWPLVWMLACAVVVALDPWALLQPGFWLSFVAVGVLFAADSGAARADSMGAGGLMQGQSSAGQPQGSEPLGGQPRQGRLAPLGGSALRAARSVGAMFREQWVITFALAPLSLLLFGQLSVVGLVANLLAIPWVTLLLTPLALLGVVLPAVWGLAAQATDLLWWWLSMLAAWPWATVSGPLPPLGWGLLAVAGGLLCALPLPWHLRALGLPLLAPLLLWHPAVPAAGEFELLAADVGQGNAVLVRTARHALLFDAGPRYSLESDAGHRVLVPLLKALDIRLDTVVLSHRDSDHVGGAAAVLAMQPQAALLSSVESEHPLQQLRTVQRCEAGQRWLWDGVSFEVLHPQAADYAVPAKPNALSCVLRIGTGAHSALLVGDIEAAQEARLVQTWQGKDHLRAAVLLVPHHGSKTSSTPEFLQAVAPQWALVQAGYRNRFGHPAPPVLARYTGAGINLVSSPQCGAMRWRSEQPQNVACTREDDRRYWHHLVP